MWLTVVEVCLLLAAIAAGLGLTLIGLPGNWLIVVAATAYKLAVPVDSRVSLSWYVVGAVTALALVGEVSEFLAGALGVAKVGGSRRAVAFALGGSVVGGIAGLFVPIPIPLIGSFLGAIVCASLGAFAGAVVGERSHGHDLDQSLPVGKAAFWGRLLGTASKLAAGVVMAVTLIVALFW